MSNLLLEKLDQFDDEWASKVPLYLGSDRPSAAFFRRESVREARADLIGLEDDDFSALIEKLRRSANEIRNYNRSCFGNNVVRKLQLILYALVSRCLELNPDCSEIIRDIGKQEKCEEIEKFLAGKSIE